jgi:hypothetical protein
MIFKKLIFLIFIVSALAFTTRDSSSKNTSVFINSDSYLYVKGTTNISNFSCDFNISTLENKIPVSFITNAGEMIFDNTVLVLETDCFDCGGKAINNDFKKILKSDNHPKIFLNLEKISLLNNGKSVEAKIAIEIAGFKKTHEIPVKIKKEHGLLVSGNLELSLNEYNLEAPKKLFGLIAINDTIEIDFKLRVQEY